LFFDSLDSDIGDAVTKALSHLEKLTGPLREVTIPARDQEQLRGTVRAAEAYAYHADLVAKHADKYQPETLVRIRAGATITTSAYIAAQRTLFEIRRTPHEVFRTIDCLITPTTPIPPPRVADFHTDVNAAIEASNRTIRNTSPFNFYGWPTISVPCGFTKSGLPIGLQIIGSMGADATVLHVAHAYEQMTDWHTRRPTLRGSGCRRQWLFQAWERRVDLEVAVERPRTYEALVELGATRDLIREPVQPHGCVRHELDEVFHIPDLGRDTDEEAAKQHQTSHRLQFPDRRRERYHLALGFKCHLAEGREFLSTVRGRNLDKFQQPCPAL
jgi:hypothetical protein